MQMKFVSLSKTSCFLDPMNNFVPVKATSEVRYDPLTGHSTRILNFPVRPVEKPDMSELIEKSKLVCPFCPGLVEVVTPKFNPELISRERFVKGDAICFPNAFPNDENAAVTVMCKEHYVAIKDFNAEILKNAIGCCTDYLTEIEIMQPLAVYQSINWNYMPLAGGSIIHPHLQVTASSTPTNYYTAHEPALASFRDSLGSKSLWHELVDAEKGMSQRFIAESDNISWLVAFAPLGIFDIVGVINNLPKASMMINGILDEIISGILKVLGYIDSLNMHSLNMSLYFKLNALNFIPHIRICPRVSIPPFGTSQINYMRMLHNEPMTTVKPESVCEGLKQIW